MKGLEDLIFPIMHSSRLINKTISCISCPSNGRPLMCRFLQAHQVLGGRTQQQFLGRGLIRPGHGSRAETLYWVVQPFKISSVKKTIQIKGRGIRMSELASVLPMPELQMRTRWVNEDHIRSQKPTLITTIQRDSGTREISNGRAG